MLVKQAHQSLLSFSNENAGIGISIELIRRLITDQLQRLSGRFSNINSNQLFRKTLKVSFKGDFDTSNLTFKFVNFINPNEPNEFFPQVEIANLKIKIEGFLEGKSVVEIEVEYSKIIGIIQLVDKRIVITLFNEIHIETSFKKLWDIDPKLKAFFESTPYNFLTEDWEQLVIHFKATSIFSATDIAETFIDSLELPDIYEVFNGIKFGDNGKLSADHTGELLMFTAESQLNFSICPTYNATGQTRVISSSKVEGIENVKYKIGDSPKNKNLIIETEIDETSPTLNYPVENNTERSNIGDIFLFTPIDLLRVNFNIVKPSITASDKGRYGPIYWRYSVTAAVKSIGLKLVNIWPIEFRLSLPTEVTGQVGAGIKIGCIRYEATGAMFDGDVDPFDINFKIYLDWPSRQIVFLSKIENIRGQNFSFRTFPQAEFPISEIIDFILGRASEYVITKQAGKILNVTRIPIANLDILDKFAEIVPNQLAGETDALGNVTMGIKFKQI